MRAEAMDCGNEHWQWRRGDYISGFLAHSRQEAEELALKVRLAGIECAVRKVGTEDWERVR